MTDSVNTESLTNLKQALVKFVNEKFSAFVKSLDGVPIRNIEANYGMVRLREGMYWIGVGILEAEIPVSPEKKEEVINPIVPPDYVVTMDHNVEAPKSECPKDVEDGA